MHLETPQPAQPLQRTDSHLTQCPNVLTMLLADVAIEPMTGLSMRVVRFNRVWLFRLDPSSGKGYDIVSLFWSPYGRHHIVIFLLLALDAFVGEHVVPLWPPVPVDVPPLPRLD